MPPRILLLLYFALTSTLCQIFSLSVMNGLMVTEQFHSMDITVYHFILFNHLLMHGGADVQHCADLCKHSVVVLADDDTRNAGRRI